MVKYGRRTDMKNNKDLSFYVYNNLRATQDGGKHELYRFEHLKDAIQKFNELPKEWTTAIGGSLNRVAEVDFVHRIVGEPVFVTDYERMDRFNGREDVMESLEILKRTLNIKNELLSGILPHISVLAPIDENKTLNSYYEGKVLSTRNGKHLMESIDDAFVEGKGWMSFKDYQNLNTNPYSNPYHPLVTSLNVKYMDPQTNYIGYMDISPRQYLMVEVQTKEYLKNKSKLTSLDETINDAKQMNGIQEKQSINEKVKDEFEK